MKKRKRLVSLLLILVMVLGVFAGCQKKDGDDDDKDKGADGPRKLTVGIPQSTTIPDYDTNKYTQYLEEVTGIDIEWVFFNSSADNYKQQLTLMATGSKEELPDVLIGFRGLGHYVVNQFGEDGYFIDLRDLLKNAPNYQEQLSKLDKDTRKYIEEKGTNTENGSFYAMPSLTPKTIDSQQSMMYINKTWLDKLGLQVPKNVTELTNVLKAFKTKDPNGNHQQDEIPMLGGDQMRYWLLNAFVEYDANNFNVKNGKVWDPVMSDEFRQGLIYANDLVKQGLFSEFGFTYTRAEMRNLISPTDGPSKVGIFCGHHETMTNAVSDVLKDFTAMGALEDATGKGGYYIVNESEAVWCNFITKDCDNPKLAMEFLDALYSDESVTRERHGEKDVDWVYQEGKNAYGSDSYAKIINDQVWFDGSINSSLMVNFAILSQWNYMAIVDGAEGRTLETNRLQKEAWDLMNAGKKQEGMLARLIYTSEEYDVREDKSAAVSSSINENTVLFMRGEKDPRNDKAWNEFKTTLNQLGRGELMKIAQDAYNRKASK